MISLNSQKIGKSHANLTHNEYCLLIKFSSPLFPPTLPYTKLLLRCWLAGLVFQTCYLKLKRISCFTSKSVSSVTGDLTWHKFLTVSPEVEVSCTQKFQVHTFISFMVIHTHAREQRTPSHALRAMGYRVSCS